MNICLDHVNLNNTLSNIFIVGRPGKGQKFYLDENGNKIEDKTEDEVEEDE